MNKHTHIEKHFQHLDILSVSNDTYTRHLSSLFHWLTTSDHASEDVTTQILQLTGSIQAHIIAKEDTTVSGIADISFLLSTHTHITCIPQTQDGSQIEKGTTLLTLHGDISDILRYERTVLNMLQRMCGIAHQTYILKQSIKTSRIAATRKTPWNLLDKKSVANGGGLTHRLHLADNILVKDNHIAHVQKTHTKNPFDAIMSYMKHSPTNILIEIEADRDEQVRGIIDMYKQHGCTHPLCILLDNYTPDRIEHVFENISEEEKDSIIFESSGGIHPSNISAYAETGVDIISCGFLTHSSIATDLSLEIT